MTHSGICRFNAACPQAPDLLISYTMFCSNVQSSQGLLRLLYVMPLIRTDLMLMLNADLVLLSHTDTACGAS